MSPSNSTGKEVFDELLELDREEGFDISSNSIGKEVFERTARLEADSGDKIKDLRGRDPRGRRDPRYMAIARSEIRESKIREGDGKGDKESYDVDGKGDEERSDVA